MHHRKQQQLGCVHMRPVLRRSLVQMESLPLCQDVVGMWGSRTFLPLCLGFSQAVHK